LRSNSPSEGSKGEKKQKHKSKNAEKRQGKKFAGKIINRGRENTTGSAERLLGEKRRGEGRKTF